MVEFIKKASTINPWIIYLLLVSLLAPDIYFLFLSDDLTNYSSVTMLFLNIFIILFVFWSCCLVIFPYLILKKKVPALIKACLYLTIIVLLVDFSFTDTTLLSRVIAQIEPDDFRQNSMYIEAGVALSFFDLVVMIVMSSIVSRDLLEEEYSLNLNKPSGAVSFFQYFLLPFSYYWLYKRLLRLINNTGSSSSVASIFE